ncbi:21113_t:CDS:2, partial [Entrophospora sp. SA101]
MSHPLKQKFSPRLLAKYPQSDYPDEDSFPSYIPMVMTQEDGSKRYGVCLTTYYAPLPDHLIEELEVLHKKWCEANMAPVPYIMGIERQYKGMDLLPEDACIVDIDRDTVLIAEQPIQIPPPYPNNRFTPHHTSTRSKIGDERSGNSIGKIGSVVGRPAQPISLAPLMASESIINNTHSLQKRFSNFNPSFDKFGENRDENM